MRLGVAASAPRQRRQWCRPHVSRLCLCTCTRTNAAGFAGPAGRERRARACRRGQPTSSRAAARRRALTPRHAALCRAALRPLRRCGGGLRPPPPACRCTPLRALQPPRPAKEPRTLTPQQGAPSPPPSAPRRAPGIGGACRPAGRRCRRRQQQRGTAAAGQPCSRVGAKWRAHAQDQGQGGTCICGDVQSVGTYTVRGKRPGAATRASCP